MLEPVDFRRLDHDAQGMASANHIGFLSELLTALKRRSAAPPIDALRLLLAMWGRAYATRPLQRAALNDVGSWYERRLRIGLNAGHRFHTLAKKMAYETANMKQLARYYGRLDRGRSTRKDVRQTAQPSFGRNILSLERMCKNSTSSPLTTERLRARGTRAGAGMVEHKLPRVTQLPDQFEARFANYEEARHAWRTLRKREKRGKPPRERLLLLQPTDERLAALAKELRVSTTKTVGLKVYFKQVASHHGAELPFQVAGVNDVVVTRIEAVE